MCQRTIFSRSCSGIAEEVQLQAEEEFILEALKKIKQQRNCLQIERLHLESLRHQLNNPVSSKEDEQSMEKESSKDSTDTTHSKQAKLMSAVDMMTLGSMQHKDDLANIDSDIQCNNQELNLNITCSGPSNSSKRKYSQYDYQSDDGSSSDASDGDNVMIDINMLMNSTARDNDTSR